MKHKHCLLADTAQIFDLAIQEIGKHAKKMKMIHGHSSAK